MRSKSVFFVFCLLVALAGAPVPAQQPSSPELQKYKLHPVPKPPGLVLKLGDHLAICGDSITEQKMYSRIMEDYLTMCVPELNISVRQYGWSGEKAPGFLSRMTNDCLRFKPTIATTCYGMNDHEYRTYEDRIGQAYRQYSTAIVEAFKTNGVRVIQGSPGCVGKVPGWVRTTNSIVEDLNLNLCTLRNIGIEIAHTEDVGFADVFWPMVTSGVTAQEKYGTNYAIAGKDGVHPGWAGHTVMAYAFLKAFGLNGQLGGYLADLGQNSMRVTPGHELISAKNGEFTIKSSRYPFCACVPEGDGKTSYPVCETDNSEKDSSIRSAMTLIPFNQELNRLMLVVRGGNSKKFKVTWGTESKSFTQEQLTRGVNLAEEFPNNPFNAAFAKVDAAIAAKQAYETKQIKQRFHSQEGKADPEGIAAETEKEREPLVDAIRAAFVPVTHTIKIAAE